jgi:hypothetical protein
MFIQSHVTSIINTEQTESKRPMLNISCYYLSKSIRRKLPFTLMLQTDQKIWHSSANMVSNQSARNNWQQFGIDIFTKMNENVSKWYDFPFTLCDEFVQ